MTAATMSVLEVPITSHIARSVERRRWGLVPQLSLPGPLKTALMVVLMDYTLYLWHVLLHRAPLLWRFHRVHHADVDLDASTALRFHVGEFVLSVPWRIGQIALLGVSERALWLWGRLTLAEVLFHHSNVRLPIRVENALRRLVVTPRLHGIHHSSRLDERSSNFSSGLTMWDVLHRTVRRDVPQDSIVIGLDANRRPEQLTLLRVLAMPLDDEPGADK
jgi:sterol desaturase/sphingolipid hydroxylase (fatty acid hydroxylase superfamily)